MLSHIRSLKPTLHYSQIGELFRYRNVSITHSGGTHLKDLSFCYDKDLQTDFYLFLGVLILES